MRWEERGEKGGGVGVGGGRVWKGDVCGMGKDEEAWKSGRKSYIMSSSWPEMID